GNHDVPRCLVAMTQVVDLDAAEQSEGCEPLPALGDRRRAEGISWLDLQLARDCLGARPHVSNNENMLDEDARSFPNREGRLDAASICTEIRIRFDRRRGIPPVGIVLLDGISIEQQLSVHIWLPGL